MRKGNTIEFLFFDEMQTVKHKSLNDWYHWPGQSIEFLEFMPIRNSVKLVGMKKKISTIFVTVNPLMWKHERWSKTLTQMRSRAWVLALLRNSYSSNGKLRTGSSYMYMCIIKCRDQDVCFESMSDFTKCRSNFIYITKLPLTVTLAHGVSFRTNLNIDSTKLAGVDSSHDSNSLTIQCCSVFMSLKWNRLDSFRNHITQNKIWSTHLHCCTPMTNCGKLSMVGVSVGM